MKLVTGHAATQEAGDFGVMRQCLPTQPGQQPPSCPTPGDVLYELLQYIKTQRQALVCGPLFGGTFRQKMPSRYCPYSLEGEEALSGTLRPSPKSASSGGQGFLQAKS